MSNKSIEVLTNDLRACSEAKCDNCSRRNEPDIKCGDRLKYDAANAFEQALEDAYTGHVATGNDPVHHPAHYTNGNLEVWDAIIGLGLGKGFLLGNVIKYVCRAGKKGDYVQDLQKAKEYIDKAIAVYEEQRNV